MKRGDVGLLHEPNQGGIYTVLRTYVNTKKVLNVFLAKGVLTDEECANHPDWDYIYCRGDVAPFVLGQQAEVSP